MHAYMSMYVSVYMLMSVYACEGQRITLITVPQVFEALGTGADCLDGTE